MKRTHRLLVWLTVVALLVTALPLSVAAKTEPPRYGRGILAQMNNAEALLYAYDTIAAGVDRAEATINLRHDTYKVTWEEVSTVFNLVHRDYPEFFWISGQASGSTSNGKVVSISPAYHMTGATLTAARNALEQKVAALTADLEGKSDYDKSLILHNRAADAITYVFNSMDQNAYGALVGGRAVCAGYARAYQLLLNAVGIPAWYVTGYSLNPATGGTEAHGWNMVQLDGQWYHSDVTWDDQKAYTFYAYLNVTDTVITADHVVYDDFAAYLPAATATTHNYFYRNDLVFDSFDAARVADVFRTYPTARFCVTYDHREFWATYSDNIMAIIEDLGFPAGDVYFGQWELGQEMILTLTAEHDCRFEPVTVAPTCGAEGYTVEECAYDFCHNQRNYVTLPATGQHTYDNACDADCNACGTVRTVGDHTYDNACDTDCNICGTVRTVGDHTYDNACDTDCNACGAVRTVGDHTYDNACDTDCNICGAVRTVGDHIYDNVYDPDCNACGAVREVITPSDNPVGDAGADQKVNNRDLVLIIRYLNGWDVEIDLYAADCDGDGAVTVKDVALLQQYVNGWDVTMR